MNRLLRQALIPLLCMLVPLLLGCGMRRGPAAVAPTIAGAPTVAADDSPVVAPVLADPASAVQLSPVVLEGNAVLVGRLLNGATNAPLPAVAVQVAPVYWTDPDNKEGTFILNTSQAPFTTSDAEGQFRFDSLADGDYVIVVGDVTMDYMVVNDENGNGKVWSVSTAAPTDVGDVPVLWQSGPP